MGLGTFTGAGWGAIRVNADAPENVAPPHDVAAPGVVPAKADAAASKQPLRIGIDAGSKTIKVVVIDAAGRTVHSLYHRHKSDILSTLADLVHELAWKHGDMTAPVSITGSAGIGISEALGIPFVQEVIATTKAVRERHPEVDCVIELGGEDAKIIYLTGGLEQRMNATCAGGTGDFIDGIAGMLNVRTRDFSQLAFGAQRTYPIASRCAVFAQTDVRPLLNVGAAKADIALSALKAVVKQTIGGLACGRPIKGTVLFLGGPLNYIPALEREFRLALGLTRQTGIRPRDAHLYTAAGAAMAVDDAPEIALSDLERRVRACSNIADDLGHLAPLFENEEERAEFFSRHAEEGVRRAVGDCPDEEVFLGFDAGSTTVKYAIVDAAGGLISWDYQHVEGDVLGMAQRMVDRALESVASSKNAGLNRRIAHASVTGYGEDLLRAAFGFDSGVVETVAHLRAAQEYRPDVSFVLDIGGQDMKALWVRDGVVVDAVLNEACSSGCGAFVRSNTRALEMSDVSFSQAALEAARPIDLGAKCTVFMTSRVRHAQKIGASRGDIAAGVAYSVVNNALTRIIGADRVASMGDAVVVQGGTFKSDAVLRAFEKVAGVHAVRPKDAHLMGAYGAALVARDRYRQSGGGNSTIVTLEELRAFKPSRKAVRCAGCGNACLLSVVEFGDGRRFVSGNRCDRAHEVMFGTPLAQSGKAPNVVELEQKLIAACGSVRAGGSRGSVRIGLMNVMNAYEAFPFWHGLFKALGFSIIVPDDEAASAFADEAAGTIPSESVCHPAKLAHIRYAYLVHEGADAVFMPRYERGTRCPVSSCYADVLRDNVQVDLLVSPLLQAIAPRGIMHRLEDRAALFQAIAPLAPAGASIGETEFDGALEAAMRAQREFDSAIAAATSKAVEWVSAGESRRGVVLIGRPYHPDPALLHRIDRELSRLGFAVVPATGLGGLRRGGARALPLWKPAKHLMGTIETAASLPRFEVVALRSFGCGYDAVAFGEARDLAESMHRPFTELKIDDIVDTAHIRIRLRTLAEAGKAKGWLSRPMQQVGDASPDRASGSGSLLPGSGSITPDLCSTAKELVRCVIEAADRVPPPYTVEIPFICQDCLVDALPFEMRHVTGYAPNVNVVRSEGGRECPVKGERPLIGLVGNPFLVFDPDMNEGVVGLLERLGCDVALPDARLLEVEDVRYFQQLDIFREKGVDHVIYLQSFGCLKGHVQSRGARHGFARRYPDMPVTVIDFDPESSALNRENRVRLAAEAAWERVRLAQSRS